MIKKTLLLIIIVSLSIAFAPANAQTRYVPRQGDYFSYHEVADVGSGTGDYAPYSDHTVTDGMERINQVFANNKTVATNYKFTSNFNDYTGANPKSWGSSGNFSWSAISFLYLKGNDSQIGYANPLAVWFYMDNSTQTDGAFTLLDTPMTVTSTSYSYHLASENRNVYAIRAQGTGSYTRNDSYGIFKAAYTWTTYFDPSTGYIIGYEWNEQDTSSSATFTYTETLYATLTSYPLTTAPATSNIGQYLVYIAAFFFVILLIVIVPVAISRRSRRLPKHTYPQVPVAPPQIDLTPKQQPPVQQIVIKEVVKVKCRYCGALIDSTVQTCPFCGAPRT